MQIAPAVLITGAAKRIGRSIAKCLHAQGFSVAIHHRNSNSEAEQLRQELELIRPNSVLVLQAELSEFDRLPEMIAKTIGRFGRLDALVNNASSFFPTPIGGTQDKDWQQLFASNAWAPFFLSQAATPHLQASKGSIVNIIDIYAERPLQQHTVYCMAKAALAMMTQSLAKELAPHVRVNAIAPGAILGPDAGKSESEKNAILA
ncbi:MAG: SDR family NAD(P)-dependent oxidoreductase, partial [Methylococcales bacterium]